MRARSYHASEAGTVSAPTGATGSGYADHGRTPTDGRRTWPTTSLLVSVTAALMFVDGSLALVGSGPFFGVTPDRDDHISAAMACLTALPAFAAMAWYGGQRGSWVGLWLLGGCAAVMTLAGLALIEKPGTSGTWAETGSRTRRTCSAT